jgi:UDP-4-amino-4,6-dideoxy-N-acetyl-beta-L-altrosamine N-acetyltransferase
MGDIGKLRDIADSELELMLGWRNSLGVRKNMYTQHEISLDEHLAWWAQTHQRVDQHYFMYEANGDPMGVVAFTGIDQSNRNAAWAFYASPQAPRGVGTKMEFLALEYAFGKLDLHKLHCEVLAINAPVIKLHQKFCFRIEGILREQKCIDGVFIDVYRLGLLATEWILHRNGICKRINASLDDKS